MENTEFPVLRTNRLLLRQIVATDLENIYAGLSHPAVTKHYGISYDSLEATKEQMAWFANLERAKTGMWWAVCLSADRTFLGAGGLNNLSQEHKKAEVGFWLLPEFWGQGLMSEAVPLICQYGFEQLRLHRIEGFVESENCHCKRTMATLDFQHEGTMRDCEIKDGEYISLDIYAKINGVK